MTLTKGSVRDKVDLEEIPEVPDAIPRDQWKRPLIVPKDGGKPVAYTRASTLGKAIDDTYHLNRWEVRAVVLGMSRREELVARAAAIPENEGEHRDALQVIGEEAKTAGGGDRGANIGTALHKLSERRDAGEDLSYLPGVLMDAMNAYGRVMQAFEVLTTETFVACDPLMTAGTFDRVVRSKVDLEFRHTGKGSIVLPAGTVLVLDLKTGKLESAKYWGPTYGVQQVVYACGDPYTPKGRLTWEELLGDGVIPSTEWAVLLHVPSDSPQDAGLVMVDLDAAAAMADLCLDIRSARKSKALMSEAYPVAESMETAEDVETSDEFELLEAIAGAENGAELDALWEANQDDWADEHTAAVKARVRALYPDEAEKAIKTAEEPAQVRKLGLIASLRYAKTEKAMEAIWERNQDIWCKEADQMVRARLRELAAVPA